MENVERIVKHGGIKLPIFFFLGMENYFVLCDSKYFEHGHEFCFGGVDQFCFKGVDRAEDLGEQ
jgi:hypothetical protein